jgi:hypothetical protein
MRTVNTTNHANAHERRCEPSQLLTGLAAGLLLLVGLVGNAKAGPLPGAIFTTTSDGLTVNGNIYSSCCLVYLNGGPGPHAQCKAAGLPDGDYYFQVTSPDGTVLLSTDDISQRMVHVSKDSGSIDIYYGSSSDCVHLTSHGPCGAVTVQLMPFSQTPNPGGEYKVWMTPVGKYNATDSHSSFGFNDADSKTDNFKCSVPPSPGSFSLSCPAELDTCNDQGQVYATVSCVNLQPIVYDQNGQDVTKASQIVCTTNDANNQPVQICTGGSADTALFPIGTTAVTCSGTDPNGGTLTPCSFNVVVGPCGPSGCQIVCAGDITVPCACGSVSVSYPDNQVTVTTIAGPTCDPTSFVCTPASGSSFPIGSTLVDCSVTDSAGVTVDCTFNVTVQAAPAPTVKCPKDTTVECGSDTTPATTGTATGTGCDYKISYSDSSAPGNCVNQVVKTITRTWTVTDACSVQVSCD